MTTPTLLRNHIDPKQTVLMAMMKGWCTKPEPKSIDAYTAHIRECNREVMRRKRKGEAYGKI